MQKNKNSIFAALLVSGLLVAGMGGIGVNALANTVAAAPAGVSAQGSTVSNAPAFGGDSRVKFRQDRGNRNNQGTPNDGLVTR